METDYQQQQKQGNPFSPKPEESKQTHATHVNNSNSSNNDRTLKRDEWSEGAVSTLLEAYEAKWILRNRAKLKGKDWEDVANSVSSRASGSKSAKTQTQCKNKIESMKKRYRSESASADASSWPLYSRLDLLLRGNGSPAAAASPGSAAAAPTPVVQLEAPLVSPTQPDPPPAPPPPPLCCPVLQPGSAAQYSSRSNGLDRLAKVDDEHSISTKSTNPGSKKTPVDDDTESSMRAAGAEMKTSNAKPSSKLKAKRTEKKVIMKQRREEYWEIGESIRWLAELVVRSEQARMETMREIERIRAEAEAKRGEVDLKRTEIIANTQLQIAKLFAKGGSLDPSFDTGRS